MSETDNLKIARSVIGAMNDHHADRYASLLDEGYVGESDAVPAPVRGREAARQMMQSYLTAFPDVHYDVESMMASGDSVITRWKATGTHKGELAGVAPTNRRMELHGCTVSEYKNGKVMRAWLYWDTGHLLRQIGVTVPALGKAGSTKASS